METPINQIRDRYMVQGQIAGLKAIIACLPGVADLDFEVVRRCIEQQNLKTDPRTDIQNVSALKIARETIELAGQFRDSVTTAA